MTSNNEITNKTAEKTSNPQANICKRHRHKLIGAKIVRLSTFPYRRKKIRTQFSTIKNKINNSPKTDIPMH